MDSLSILSLVLGLSSLMLAVLERSGSIAQATLKLRISLMQLGKSLVSIFEKGITHDANVESNKQLLNYYQRRVAHQRGLFRYIDIVLAKGSFPSSYVPFVKLNVMTWYNLKTLLEFFGVFEQSKISTENRLTRSFFYRFDRRIHPNNILRESLIYASGDPMVHRIKEKKANE